ncbi:MAG: MFS transporter [Ruminococcaceae bacterium]|nr:MFS transporter [Oscillospiraceae bacterium]
MVTLLISIIYIAFISLGLPDSLLGSAWPTLHTALSVPLSYAGIVSAIITGGTIVSSLLSDRVTRRFGTGLVTAGSTLLTAAALLGFSLSDKFFMLCIFAVPYGIGAGAIDAALNNYVAIHYSARHMSWLHCMWGVGASISPYIMSFALGTARGWQGGYFSVSVIQFSLTAFLFLSLGLWKKSESAGEKTKKRPREKNVFKIKGVVSVLITFFGYCALESTAGLWASSYLVEVRGIDAAVAARFAALFYMGITFGRFLCGFVADRLGDKTLIRVGLSVIGAGILCLALPMELCAKIGLCIVGIGCAPIYPSVIHSTPHTFGEENSQKIIGLQMASAYTGSALMPPLFGALTELLPMAIYPLYLALFACLMIIMSERLNKLVA